MKKIIFLIISLFLLVNYSVLGQDYCGTETPAFDQSYSSLARMEFGRVEGEDPICINVAFHIVTATNSTGTKYDDEVDTQALIDKLNDDYRDSNISFVSSFLGKKEEVDIIRDSNFLDILVIFKDVTGQTQYDNLVRINNDPNALNVYLVDYMYYKTFFDDVEIQGRGKILGRNLVMEKKATEKHVISHEAGHCFNLYHTHEKEINGLENSTNCTVAGDLVCDTPPDPDLRNRVNDKCEYETPKVGYDNPDIKNIMSYTNEKCQKHFTNGQMIRMRDAILQNQILRATN